MFKELVNFFTSTRGVDVFWSPLLVTVIGGIILAIILRSDRAPQKKRNKKNNGLTLGEVRELIRSELDQRPKQQTTPRQRPSNFQSDDNSLIVLISIGLIFLSIGYARFQEQVLDYSVIVATSLFGFWITTVIFALLKGTISGISWTIYTVSVCFFSLLALPILYLSLNPIYSPTGITNITEVATKLEFFDFVRTYGSEGFSFLLFQVLGFIVLYFSWLFILLTLIYMASSTLVVSGAKGRSFWFWLSLRTSRFAKPIRSTVVISILYVLAFLLISGVVYEWLRPINST